jgi:short-subunit dehydrogenase
VNVIALTSSEALPSGDAREAQRRILNVASTAAFQPGPLMAVYYATKAYVLSFRRRSPTKSPGAA